MADRADKVELSTPAIVDAAIELADAQGLDAVSIRNLAGILCARPMNLYGFIESKDHLVGEMIDGVIAEMLLDRVPSDWKAALRAIALRTVEVGRRHRWFIEAITRSTAVGPGPHTQRHGAQSLQAVEPLGMAESVVRPLLVAIDVYTMGVAISARADRPPQDLRADEHAFCQGLDWLIDGFERSQVDRSDQRPAHS